MKYTLILLAAAAAVNAGKDCWNEGGNFFCGGRAVKQIKYNGLDLAGSYRAVKYMDNSGACTFEDRPYAGPIAPYDEELSFHLRGPFHLDAFAVYTPSIKAKIQGPKSHSKRHGHGHLHQKYADEKHADMVTAVIDGITQTWENKWFGPTAAPEKAPATSAMEHSEQAPNVHSYPTKGGNDQEKQETKQEDKDQGKKIDVPAGDYERVALYNAASQIADGLVFLANKGDPAVSGTFDNVWGNSLSYVSADGSKCASSPTVLGDVQVGDGDEIAIYSDKECDESCGTVRPGSVAYKGWAGPNKVFLMEFSMPDTGTSGWNLNMPAAWLLNAAIARTGQYSACSCWKGDKDSPIAGGCGEADIFEVLASGDKKAKSTFHFAHALGDSHYFDRPVDKSIKLAVVFHAASSTTSIKILDDNYNFATSLNSKQIDELVDDEPDFSLMSLMTFGGF
ncbi:hypothetical protein DL765_000169 [Monosporascus sp. GIB2]|nr:hypothetical protein DL765_000169 [Monosporascus sp. GIB2]